MELNCESYYLLTRTGHKRFGVYRLPVFLDPEMPKESKERKFDDFEFLIEHMGMYWGSGCKISTTINISRLERSKLEDLLRRPFCILTKVSEDLYNELYTST